MSQINVHSRQRSRQGSVLVEFTLLVPVLVLLFLGGIGFGYGFHTYNRLEETVRAGARYASMRAYDAYTGIDPSIPSLAAGTSGSFTISGASQFLTAVQNMVVYGMPIIDATSPQQPIVEGMTPANVGVTLGIVGFGTGYPVTIRTVSVAVQNLPLRLLVGNVTLNKPVTQFQYVGTYSPATIK